MKPTITTSHYHASVSLSLGWCQDCEEFTRECTEPDAEGYDCPTCDGSNVVGAEQALIMELFDIEEDESEDDDE